MYCYSRIKDLREDKDLVQKEVAEVLNIPLLVFAFIREPAK